MDTCVNIEVGRFVPLLSFPVFSTMILELLARHACAEYDIPVNEEWLSKIRFDSANLNTKIRRFMELFNSDTLDDEYHDNQSCLWSSVVVGPKEDCTRNDRPPSSRTKM